MSVRGFPLWGGRPGRNRSGLRLPGPAQVGNIVICIGSAIMSAFLAPVVGGTAVQVFVRILIFLYELASLALASGDQATLYYGTRPP